MKKLLTLIVTCLATMQAQSQRLTPEHLQLSLTASTGRILSQQLKTDASYKGTAINKRLIAHSRYEDTVITDSVRHVYNSQLRGSSHPHGWSYFNNGQNQLIRFRAIDPVTVQYIQSDTTVVYHRDVNFNFVQYNKAVFSYNSNNHLTHGLHEDEEQTYEYIIVNNSNGSPATVTQRDSTSTPGYGDKLRHNFMYNSQGKIILDSIELVMGAPTPYHNIEYYYNSGGYLTKHASVISGQPFLRNEIVYDGSNRILTNTLISGVSRLEYRDTFTYTGSASHFTNHIRQYWDSAGQFWESDWGEIVELDANGLVKRKYSMNDGGMGYDTLTKQDYTLNSNGLYERIDVSFYTGNGQFTPPLATLHFYYEDYGSVSVSEIPTHDKGMVLYPNPATNSIIVELSTSASIPSHILIVDNIGRVVKQIASNTHKTTLDVYELPQGVYFIQADNLRGKFSIIK